MIDESLMRTEERAAFALQALYRRSGYLPFRMNRFEEYDFYARNKDFLVSDRIITFTDSRGRLLALKPDVTLSIIKSGSDRPGCKQRLCYSEKVFRASDPIRADGGSWRTGSAGVLRVFFHRKVFPAAGPGPVSCASAPFRSGRTG